MTRLLVSLLLFVATSVGAETSIGLSQPFYLDKNLDRGEVGGYGFHIEYAKDRWYASYDRLQDVVRDDDGFIESQDFINAGYRYTFNGFQLSAGLSLNERSDVLGSPVNFNVGFGYEWKRIRISWRHWSNANTNEVNHGFDAITFAWRFRN